MAAFLCAGRFLTVTAVMEKRTIWVKPSCFTPEIEMIIPIPEDRDAEEYIDEFLDTILCEDLKYNVEWDFSDGIS